MIAEDFIEVLVVMFGMSFDVIGEWVMEVM
jgi:hypothetical protein